MYDTLTYLRKGCQDTLEASTDLSLKKSSPSANLDKKIMDFSICQ